MSGGSFFLFLNKEGIMFEELTDCVHYEGKEYCWNYKTKQIEEIVRKPVDIVKCPPAALKKLLEYLGNKNKWRNYVNKMLGV